MNFPCMLCPNCINQKYGELFYKSLTQCDDENRKINSYYFLIMGNMYVVMSKLKDRISTDNKHMIKYIMRKIVLSLFALCCFSAVMAQQKTRNLSVELLGAQNIVGINYDSRFEGNSGLGYRVGIGYGYGDNSGLGLFDQKINGVGVPLELNYLLGKKNSKLELGFGASLGVYQVKETIGYKRYREISRWGEYRRNFS